VYNIDKLTTLLRGYIELPDCLKLETEEFREGWSFVQSGDMHWLDKRIRACGWHFIWIGEGLLKHGVGKTSEEAVASALKITLRRINKRFNAAEVELVEVKKYPWFFLAGVKVHACQIQQSSVLSSFSGVTPQRAFYSVEVETKRPIKLHEQFRRHAELFSSVIVLHSGKNEFV
jgi:hypothetical protein